MITVTHSAEKTQALGRLLAKKVKRGLLCLYGPLGAGKTTLIRGLAKGLGIRGRIQSPTYTFCRVYRGKRSLYHFDCYRLDKPDRHLLLQIFEALSQHDSLVAIEWASRILKFLPKPRVDVHLNYTNGRARKIRIHRL